MQTENFTEKVEEDFKKYMTHLECECNKELKQQIVSATAGLFKVEESYLKTLLETESECEYKHLLNDDSLVSSNVGELLVQSFEKTKEGHHGVADFLFETANKDTPGFVTEFLEGMKERVDLKSVVREAAKKDRWDVVLFFGEKLAGVKFDWIWKLSMNTSVMDLAIEKGDISLIENLLDLDLRAPSKCGEWYIDCAAMANNLPVLQLIVSKAELHRNVVEDIMYRTIRKGFREVTDYLFELGREREWWTVETFTKNRWVYVVDYFRNKMYNDDAS